MTHELPVSLSHQILTATIPMKSPKSAHGR